MRILPSHNNSQLTLPPDFVAFLDEIPRGFAFNLEFLQGALRFTRDGIPAEQTFERELKAAQEMGLIREVAEDLAFTASRREECGRTLRYGASFEKIAARA